MSETEDYMKIRNVETSIYFCHKFPIEIKISDEAMNAALHNLLLHRREIAGAYVRNKSINGNDSITGDLLLTFSKYNEEIIKLLGLHTI